MAEESFRLPGSSYQELTKIIIGYGRTNSEAAPGDIAKVVAIHPTIISRNNAFLVAIGVLEGGKKKILTKKGRDLARALEHEMPDDIKENWKRIVLDNDFLQKLISAVIIRKGMEPSTLQAHVAYSAGQSKSQMVMTGAGAVVDILKASGLLKEEDGKLILVPEEEIGLHAEHLTPAQHMVGSQEIKSKQASTIPIVSTPIGKEVVAVTIQIQIQCSANEIEGLAPKIHSLLKSISNPNAPEKREPGE